MSGMRVQLVSGDIRPLTRAMNALGKDARPVFRDVGDAVANRAARDIGAAAGRHSAQSRAMLRAVESRRDRVPYVHVLGTRIFRRQGRSKRTSVRVRDLMMAVEFGTRPGNIRHEQITQRHNSDRPQKWNVLGYWFYPTINANVDRYTRMYADALSVLVDRTLGRL